ncbi:hypothetical protein T439DRAFT_357653 [Meredithblackwellia eburnea MCA 4105]
MSNVHDSKELDSHVLLSNVPKVWPANCEELKVRITQTYRICSMYLSKYFIQQNNPNSPLLRWFHADGSSNQAGIWISQITAPANRSELSQAFACKNKAQTKQLIKVLELLSWHSEKLSVPNVGEGEVGAARKAFLLRVCGTAYLPKEVCDSLAAAKISRGSYEHMAAIQNSRGWLVEVTGQVIGWHLQQRLARIKPSKRSIRNSNPSIREASPPAVGAEDFRNPRQAE